MRDYFDNRWHGVTLGPTAPDGSRVFVTGSAFGLGRYVYATVAYAA